MARILILDDRATNREFLVTLLGYAGHTLIEAGDAEMALRLVRQLNPDLVIADVLMPEVDGFEFVRHMRTDPTIAHTRVIFYTAAYGVAEVRALAAACGVNYVLTKPTEPQVILDTVQSALGSPILLSPASIGGFERDHHRLLLDKLSQQINELEHLNDELRSSREQLLMALEVGGLGMWIIDAESHVIWWDDAALALWDRTRNDVANGCIETALSFVHPEDQDRVRSELEQLLKSDETLSNEFRILLPSGEIRWIGFRGRNETNQIGTARRVIGVCVDITTRKQTEESRIRSQKLEALGTLARGIAHDFNNILLAITAHLQFAITDLPETHPIQANLAEIDKASNRATDLVRRILTFSRPQEQQRQHVPLTPIITDALTLLQATLPHTIAIQTDYQSPDLEIDADVTQLHQLIINVVTNAAHAIGDASGRIHIQLERVWIDPEFASTNTDLHEGWYARLVIADTGCGMDQATLAQIFDPFFTTKPVGQGTGLGLSVVHGILKSHGAAVLVESTLGHGSRFQFFFPALPAAH